MSGAGHPRDDLLSALITGERADRLRGDELLTMAALLFAAGFETATHLLGNGLVALLRHPAELDRWRRSTDLSASAVDELSGTTAPSRSPGESPCGTPGSAARGSRGAGVVVCLGAANHDPRATHTPAGSTSARADGGSMSFGGGIHYCLGAALARLEAQVAFPSLSVGSVSCASRAICTAGPA